MSGSGPAVATPPCAADARARLGYDVVVVLALVGAMYLEAWWATGIGGALTVGGVLAIPLAALPTLWRHRRPGFALAECVVAMFVVFSFVDVHNTAPFGAMLCGYELALVVDRRRTVVAGLLVAPAVVALIVVFGGSAREVVSLIPRNLALVAAPLLLGAAVRNRRAYLAALLDRAETAERTREEEAARRVSEERLRIAQDVHDVVSHAIVAINVQTGVALHLLDRHPDDVGRARRTLHDVNLASAEALGDLRATLGVLRAAADGEAPRLPSQGLTDLPDLVAGLRSAGVSVCLDVDPHALGVPAGVDTTGYRIVQEALTNVVRHAGGSTARVGVRREPGRVVIEVDDDGPAGPPATGAGGPAAVATGSGNGVRGMRERAAAVGGTLDAGPHGAGWRVRAELPG